MKAFLTLLIAFGMGFGDDFDACKYICKEQNGDAMCIREWGPNGPQPSTQCQSYLEEKKQKCLDDCRLENEKSKKGIK